MKNILNNVTLCIHVAQVPGAMVLTKMNKRFDNTGFISKFTLLIQEYLGFRYDIIEINYGKWNNYLMKNRIDLALPVSQNFERSKIMDFSQPLFIDAIKFFVGKPEELSKITAIFRPFSFHVWIAIIFTFVISLIIFTMIIWNDAKLHKRKYVKLSEIAWALFGSFTCQGHDLFHPSGNVCQLLISGWILAIFIITSSYSGALMSFITFPGREAVPRTYSQLVNMANNRDYTISLRLNGVIMKFISNSMEGAGVDIKRLIELNEVEDGWLDSNLANRILKEKLAYIFFETGIDIYISKFGSDNFLISEDQLFSTNVGFGMSKTFPYKKEINEAIIRFVETGFYVKFLNDDKFQGKKKHQSILQENMDILHTLDITDLSGPLILLIFGYLLSTVVFFIELIVNKIH